MTNLDLSQGHKCGPTDANQCDIPQKKKEKPKNTRSSQQMQKKHLIKFKIHFN